MSALALLAFQLRLAWASLRRDRFFSVVTVLGVAISIGAFGVAYVGNDLLSRRPPAELQARLFAVKLALDEHAGQGGLPSNLVSWRDHGALASSPVPARRFGAYAGHVHLRHAGRDHRLRAWFVDPDFFPVLGLPFARGRPFGGAAAEVVLSHALSRRLFGRADPEGARVSIQGVAHRVAGALGRYELLPRFHDLAAYGEEEGDLYLPLASHQALRVRPDTVVAPRRLGPRLEDLWASDATFVTHFVELPTAELRASYARDLAGRVCPPHGARLGAALPCELEPLPGWIDRLYPVPGSARFILLIAIALLAASALGLVRLLMARFLVRASEIGIQRVVGASRGHVLVRHLLEGQILALGGGLLGVALMYVLVPLTGVVLESFRFPWRVPPAAIGIAIGTAALAGLVASLYPAWRVGRLPAVRLLRRG